MFLKIDFATTRSLYHNYIQNAKSGKKFNTRLAPEVSRRLKQLEMLMEIIATKTIRETNSRHTNIPSERLWMYVECFYYLAFRTRKAIRSLPGLSSFDCPGIRNVRNKLLEHPDNADNRMFRDSFSWGRASGPLIKARRLEKEIRIFPDAGLYANYLEFQENFNRLLKRATSVDRSV